MTEEIKGLIWGILFVVFCLNIAATVAGMGSRNTITKSQCEEPTTRIGYLLPGFDFGCWLADVPGRHR
jgi:hypothetical protein